LLAQQLGHRVAIKSLKGREFNSRPVRYQV